jgi:hypothetical protein
MIVAGISMARNDKGRSTFLKMFGATVRTSHIGIAAVACAVILLVVVLKQLLDTVVALARI